MRRLLFLGFAVIVFFGSAVAGTLYTNFGPGFSVDGHYVSWVQGPSSGGQFVADQFTPSATAQFTEALLALGKRYNDGVTNTARVFLETDASGAPGTILEEIDVAVSGLGYQGLVVATSVLEPVLSAGTPYWLVVGGSGSDSLGWPANYQVFGDTSGRDSWNNTSSPTGPWYGIRNTFPTSFPRNAFEIDGANTVPEPSSILLLCAGLATLALKKRCSSSPF